MSIDIFRKYHLCDESVDGWDLEDMEEIPGGYSGRSVRLIVTR